MSEPAFFRFTDGNGNLRTTEIECKTHLCDDLRISERPIRLAAFGDVVHATIPVNLGALGDILFALDLDQLLDWADQVRAARKQEAS